MDIGARYERLSKELGNLDLEILVRDRRRTEIRAEMELLQRMAAEITRAQPKQPATQPDEG